MKQTLFWRNRTPGHPGLNIRTGFDKDLNPEFLENIHGYILNPSSKSEIGRSLENKIWHYITVLWNDDFGMRIINSNQDEPLTERGDWQHVVKLDMIREEVIEGDPIEVVLWRSDYSFKALNNE